MAEVRLDDKHVKMIRDAKRIRGVSNLDIARVFGWASDRPVVSRLRAETRTASWPAEKFAELGPLFGKPPLWPLFDFVRANSLAGSARDRISRFFRLRSRVLHETVLAVEALATDPERWPDSVIEAMTRAIAPPPRRRGNGRRDGDPEAA